MEAVKNNPIQFILAKIVKYQAYVSAFCIALSALIAVIDVITSKFIGWSVPGASESIEQLNIPLIFLAIGYVQLDRGHIRVDVLDNLLPKTALKAIRILSHLFGFSICSFIGWRTLILMQRSISVGETALGVSWLLIWPFILCMFFGWAFMAITSIAEIVRGIAGWERVS